MKTIDVYRFDKTIYKKNSVIEFYKFCLKKNKRLIKYFLNQLFNYILFKITKKDKFKENLCIFLKDINNVENEIEEFWKINKKDIREELLHESSNEKVIISDSPKLLIKKICSKLEINHVITTNINFKIENFETKDCCKKEKVKRLDEEIENYKIDNFFSNSYYDDEIAKVSKKAFIIDKNGKKNNWNFNKINRAFKNLINNMYLIMYINILVICLFFSHREYAYRKDYLINNWFSLLISITVFAIIYKIIYKLFKQKEKSKISNMIVLIFSILLVFILFYNARNYLFVTGWDAGRIRYNADYIATGYMNKIENDYYSNFSNNILITYLVSFIIKLSYLLEMNNIDELMLLFNCCLFSFTGFFVFKIVEKLYQNLQKSILAYILYILLIGISPWIVIVYSDSMALFLITLGVFLYIKYEEKSKLRWLYMILYLFIMFLGYNIKPQVILLFITTIIYKISKLKIEQLKNKSIYINISLIVVTFVLSMFIINYVKYNTYFNIDKEARFGVANYLMWGHNYRTRGVYPPEDLIYSSSFNTNKERDIANIEKTIERIKQMRLKGLIELYIDKTLTNYNDGSFAFNEEGGFYSFSYEEGNEKLRNIYQNYYYSDGRNVKVFYTIQQIIWIGILFFNLFALKKEEDYRMIILKFSIIGLTLFELLFEARARYLFAYAPIYIIISIRGLENIYERK